MNRKQMDIVKYLFLLIPFFKPVGLATISGFNSIMQLWKVVSIVLLLLFYFPRSNNQRLFKNNKGIIGFLIFGIVYVVNCVRFGNDYSNILNNFITDCVLMYLIISTSVSRKKKINAFMSALCYLFIFWIIVQSLSIFVVRAGFLHLSDGSSGDYCYIFGTDNYSAFAMIPMIVVSCYIMRLKNSKRNYITKSIILCALVTVGYVYVRSISAAVACLLLLVFQVFSGKWKKLLKHITVKKTLLFLAIILFLIIRYDIQNYFLHFIAEVLGKGDKATTLNSRTIIWSMAIDLIKSKPKLGYGAFSQEMIDNYILYGIEHTHNLLLELLIRTGILGTMAYFYFLLVPLTKNYKKLLRSKSNILVCGMIIFLVLSFMDVYPLMQYQYVLFAFLYCWENMEKAYSDGECGDMYYEENRCGSLKLQEL